MNQTVINILGEEIPCHYEMLSIEKLRFFFNNPRVYSCINGQVIPDDPDERQALIEKQMLQEPSVKNLIPRIKKHGGLQESILVRYDTMEVIEGNSRLTVYRYLDRTDLKNKGKWERIHCQVVSSLTDKQQYAYLSQVHIEGKTPWVSYEKANQAFVMKKKEQYSDDDIAATLGISKLELDKRVRVIEIMDKSGDQDRSHFSHYNVLLRTRKIAEELDVNPKLKKLLISKIRGQGKEGAGDSDFKAQDLRDKLPIIIEKKRTLQRFMDSKLSLDEAYQNARLSGAHQNIKAALDKILDIEKAELQNLSPTEINSALITAKKLCKESDRIRSILLKEKGL